MSKQLPVASTFRTAFSLPLRYPVEILKFGYPLIAITLLALLSIYLLGADYFNYLFNVDSVEDAKSISDFDTPLLTIGLIIIGGYILGGIAMTYCIIGFHRTFISGENYSDEPPQGDWTKGILTYMGWLLILGILTFIIILPFLFIFSPFLQSGLITESPTDIGSLMLGLVINLWVGYFLSRWALLLPATSMKHYGLSLSWAWNLSTGNALRLLILLSLFPFFTSIILSIVFAETSILLMVFEWLIWAYVVIVEIGLLSLSYQWLVENYEKKQLEEESTEDTSSGN